MLLTLLVILPMAPLFLSLGQLQGERRYGAYATAFALWGVPRPLFLIPLALAGLEVSAAIGATALALVTAATVAAVVTAPRLAGPLAPRGRRLGGLHPFAPAGRGRASRRWPASRISTWWPPSSRSAPTTPATSAPRRFSGRR